MSQVLGLLEAIVLISDRLVLKQALPEFHPLVVEDLELLLRSEELVFDVFAVAEMEV